MEALSRCLVRRAATTAPKWSRQFNHRTVPGLAQFQMDFKVQKFGFLFDIDGVLLRESRPLPHASATLRSLQKAEIPFILLTNGGGKLESERAAQLSEALGVPISEDMVVLSHTPLRSLAGNPFDRSIWGDQLVPARWHADIKENTVLALGSDGERCRRILQSYGFEKVVIPADILHAQPSIWPFDPLLSSVYAGQHQPLPGRIWSPELSSHEASRLMQIDAVFVLNDPRDWALDLQITLDVLRSSHGRLGTRNMRLDRARWLKEEGNEGEEAEARTEKGRNDHRSHAKLKTMVPGPTIVFTNQDQEWATGYHNPRLGQGSFLSALKGMWDGITTGSPALRYTALGKPTQATMSYAVKVLQRKAAAESGSWSGSDTETEAGDEELDDLDELDRPPENADAPREPNRPLKQMYMVGDNLESDIQGANLFEGRYGEKMVSCLVCTGVYQNTGHKFAQFHHRFRPSIICPGVKDVVAKVLQYHQRHDVADEVARGDDE